MTGTKPLWYKRFRGAAYASAAGSLLWTILVVLPVPPFSYIPPLIVGGGPGIWFVLAYLIFLSLGVGGFGAISGFLYTVEVHERRSINSSVMWPAFVLLAIGVSLSCTLLAVAGAVGGYASSIDSVSGTAVRNLLGPYVYPITTSSVVAVLGAVLTLYAMIRASWPAT